MANQLNFQSILTGTLQRPDRISEKDLNLIKTSQKQIIFGTNVNDTVEVYVYNLDGSFAGHLVVDPLDTLLSLTTLIDNTGTYETLNVDMAAVSQRLALEEGRYGLVLNFFRSEVGSENGYKFYIADISKDRTEVLLSPVEVTSDVLNDVYEFVDPSVPKIFAKGLVDEIFGQAISAPASEILTIERVQTILDSVITNFSTRLIHAELSIQFSNLLNVVLARTYTQTIELMANDVKNFVIHKPELENYIVSALSMVLANMTSAGEVDPRFQLR